MNEKTIKPRAHRTIKIEVSGDMFRKKTCPKIRLQGKWLEELGFKQEGRVEIIPIAPGVIILRCVEELNVTSAFELNEASGSYGSKL
jgi:hypothetical protein